MDLKARSEHIEAVREKLIQDHEAHVAQLYHLENDRGVDLDVFTDIYGLDVLDLTDSASAITASWVSLCEALVSDASLVVIATPYSAPRTPLLIGGHERTKYQATQFTVIDMDNKFQLSFSKQVDTEHPSAINLVGANTLTLRTNSNQCGVQEWSRGTTVLAQPRSFQGFTVHSDKPDRFFAAGIMNPSTDFGIKIVGLKKDDSVTKAFEELGHKDENLIFGTLRIQEELDRILV